MLGPILITGASGQVGGELLRLFPDAIAPGRDQLDLADPASIRAMVRAVKPRWILNPGAYTAVDKAEGEPDVAYSINAIAPGVLGEEAHALGAAVLHFSTDYVFPGEGTQAYTEDDPTGPLGVYGASKLVGEQALAASGAAHLVLRTSWVYGATGKNFLLTVLRVARERAEMKIVADQHGAPTTARELARVSHRLLAHCAELPDLAPVSGVYHAAGAGETTWFGFAEHALRLRRLAEPTATFATLLPIPSSEYPTPARRPLNSRLNCGKLERVFGIQMKPWADALEEVSAELPLS